MENICDRYITTAKAREQLGVATLTLHNWEAAGKIETTKTPGGHRLYNVDKYIRDNKTNSSKKTVIVDKNKKYIQDDKEELKKSQKEKSTDKKTNDCSENIIENIDTNENNKNNNKIKKENVCYIRVSSVGSKSLLKKQKDYMKEKYPTFTIVEDIGSPLVFNKVGLKKIIDLAIDGKIDTLVITNNNNISSYGFELLEYLIKTKGSGKIIVDGPTEDVNFKKDMIDDINQIMSTCVEKLSNLKNILN